MGHIDTIRQLDERLDHQQQDLRKRMAALQQRIDRRCKARACRSQWRELMRIQGGIDQAAALAATIAELTGNGR